MTVIMAAAFSDGIAIAADTLLHNPDTGQRVMNSDKTSLVAGRVGVAQSGTFTGTQDVWDKLEEMDPAAVTPRSVADMTLAIAGSIHKTMRARGEQSSSVYLVAGYSSDGDQEIYAVEIENGEIRSYHGEGQIAALGTTPNVIDIATQAVRDSFIGTTNTFKVDEWVHRVVAAVSDASPRTVGFPATLLLIRPHHVEQAQVEQGHIHQSRLRGFFA